MPEGDTIWRIAARLRPALEGRPLRRFDAPRLAGPRPEPGERVDGVEAAGKHLLIRFSGGVVLQTHLRMTGSWHLYRRGERWRKPPYLARVVIEVEDWAAVCFAAPVVRAWVGGETGTAHLGPDLCAADVDVGVALDRLAALAEADDLICDVLLDQRIAAGIGNVYKSEVLWGCRVHPQREVGQLDDATRRCLYELAHRLLRANLTTPQRTTVAGTPGGLAVYGRRNQPCRRCGGPISQRTLGRNPRLTYWCPHCQPAPRGGRAG